MTATDDLVACGLAAIKDRHAGTSEVKDKTVDLLDPINPEDVDEGVQMLCYGIADGDGDYGFSIAMKKWCIHAPGTYWKSIHSSEEYFPKICWNLPDFRKGKEAAGE